VSWLPNRLLVICACLGAAAGGAVPAETSGGAPATLVTATGPGALTLDGRGGTGNPFAAAFVRLLADRDLPLDAFLHDLAKDTEVLSGGFQRPPVPDPIAPAQLALGRRAANERRIALVLVFSGYRQAGLPALPGARFDGVRVQAALAAAGFETRLVVDPPRGHIEPLLDAFAAASEGADTARVYATGHGGEVAGTGFLLPPGYPMETGASALPTRGLALARILAAMRARSANLLFYAGCRNDPFTQGSAARQPATG
jgi:hypothetical protein